MAPSRAQCTRPLSAQSGGTNPLCGSTSHRERSGRRISVFVGAVAEWTIYLVQHSHTDIGYTRPQTEILPEHLRYIDYALDYCDQTDDYPDNAKFRWTCEASWAVREYLESRPETQIDRLLKRIKEGRIEVTRACFSTSQK
ncbi:MAG: hypothetical protein IPJ40_19425 [Saprospirales bacterium]|nr:hypothetical protein [Saprospirales bacterium]